jgi:hypothetical protein
MTYKSGADIKEWLRYMVKEGFRIVPLFTFLTVICISVCTGILFIFVSHDMSQSAYAHVSSEYGNITLTTGWDQEPPLVDELNHIVVGVTRESEDEGGTSSPVRNAMADMNVMIKYGGVTKSLDFVPSEEEAGWYESMILPTRIGSYNLTLNGTIQDQLISDEVHIEDVESKQIISFPATASDSSGGETARGTSNINLASGRIANVLNSITNDINNVREDIRTLAEASSNIEQGIQDVRDIAERSYMLAITAIGVGAAGILIGAAALLRRR